MPERQITAREREQLEMWLKGKAPKDASLIKEWGEGYFSALKTYFTAEVNKGQLWEMGKETLLIRGKGSLTPGIFGYNITHTLICSDNHAQQLEEAGIVNFSEKPQNK